MLLVTISLKKQRKFSQFKILSSEKSRLLRDLDSIVSRIFNYFFQFFSVTQLLSMHAESTVPIVGAEKKEEKEEVKAKDE